MKIIELAEQPKLINEAVDFFWKAWGNAGNFKFYEDCIKHSLKREVELPKFYLGLQEGKIIASYALLTNDLVSRQDLWPWFACLYVNEEDRGRGLAAQLLADGLTQAEAKGFDKLYLSTDLENFYERKGWEYFDKAYGVSGDEFKVYWKSTKQ